MRVGYYRDVSLPIVKTRLQYYLSKSYSCSVGCNIVVICFLKRNIDLVISRRQMRWLVKIDDFYGKVSTKKEFAN